MSIEYTRDMQDMYIVYIQLPTKDQKTQNDADSTFDTDKLQYNERFGST